MAKKVAYRAIAIDKLTSAALAALLTGAVKLVVAIDVAKTKMMAGFGREYARIVRLVRFNIPIDAHVRRVGGGDGQAAGRHHALAEDAVGCWAFGPLKASPEGEGFHLPEWDSDVAEDHPPPVTAVRVDRLPRPRVTTPSTPRGAAGGAGSGSGAAS